MTAECQSSKALEEAFRAALLLTGSPEAAEFAVLGGIAASAFGHVTDQVLVESAKAAIQCRADFPIQSGPVLLRQSRELQRLLLLAPIYRDCFILRLLLGINVETCSNIMGLGIEEFGEALYAALHELPSLETDSTGH